MTLPISQDLSNTQPVPLGMGRLVAQYPLNRRGRLYGQAIAGFMIFFVIGLALLSAGGYITLTSVEQFGPSVTWKLIRWPLLLGAVSVLIGLVNAIRFLIFRRQSLELYESGFIYREWKKVVSWRWDELSAIQEKVTRQSMGILAGRVHHRYQLTSPAHKDLVLDDRFSRVDQFIAQAQQTVFPGHYAQAAQAYNGGDLLTFGPVGLNQTGILVKGKQYAWKAVGQGTIDKGYLVFSLLGSPSPAILRIAVEQIPNFDVLIAILKYIQG